MIPLTSILAGRLRRFLISDTLLHATQRQTRKEPGRHHCDETSLHLMMDMARTAESLFQGPIVLKAVGSATRQFMTVRTRLLNIDGWPKIHGNFSRGFCDELFEAARLPSTTAQSCTTFSN